MEREEIFWCDNYRGISPMHMLFCIKGNQKRDKQVREGLAWSERKYHMGVDLKMNISQESSKWSLILIHIAALNWVLGYKIMVYGFMGTETCQVNIHLTSSI